MCWKKLKSKDIDVNLDRSKKIPDGSERLYDERTLSIEFRP